MTWHIQPTSPDEWATREEELEDAYFFHLEEAQKAALNVDVAWRYADVAQAHAAIAQAIAAGRPIWEVPR